MQRLFTRLFVIALAAGIGSGLVACGDDEVANKAEVLDHECVMVDRKIPRDNRLAAFDTTDDWLFAGALVMPAAAGPAIRPNAAIQRAPLTFSVGQQITLNGSRQATMANPSLSAYRKALDERLATGTTGDTAANIEWDTFGLTKEGQVGTLLNLDASVPLVTRLENSFNWTDKSVVSRNLLRFTQLYYTVDVDKPATAADLFAAGVPAADINKLADSGALYVSSISYGRSVLIAYESRHTNSEVNNALHVELGWGDDVWGANAGLTAWSSSALSETSFSGYIYGGSAADAVRVYQGLDNLADYINNGANFSPRSPGVPISYQLSAVKDNASPQSTAPETMTEEVCDMTRAKVRVTLKSIQVDSGGELELCGLVTASGGSRSATLFDQNCDDPNFVISGPGSPWESGDETEFDLPARRGESIEIRTHVREHRSGWSGGTTDIQDRTLRIRFEDVWHGRKDIRVTRGDRRVTVVMELTALNTGT